jgi:hypothetical protein
MNGLSPLQIMLEGQRDEKSMRALSEGLRNNKDISMLASLLGTQNQREFGRGLGADVQYQQGLKEKQDQRYMTQDQYAAANQHRRSVLDETTRHNMAMEDYYRNKDKAAVTAQQKALTRGVTDLSKRLEKAAIPDLKVGIAKIDEELSPYLEAGGNLPGVGGLSNVGGFSFTGEGRRMQARVAKIRNMILKARSGGAVTPQEADRLLQEFSLGMWNSDADFLASWADFKDSISAGERNIMGGYGSEIRDAYEMNMRALMEDPEADPASPSAGGGELTSSQGYTYTVNE